jgi:hypothetical protein
MERQPDRPTDPTFEQGLAYQQQQQQQPEEEESQDKQSRIE